jgi:3',5'-cyclic-AMP phosphodiesterase
MGRPDPFSPQDGCGDGWINVHPNGLVDKAYNLWNRNIVTVPANYTLSRGKQSPPAASKNNSY